jgi:glycosyltransferase involved in cell wall biosynthesis
MRIGIDGRSLTGRYTGDRTYWLNLLRNHIEEAERDPDARNEYLVYSRLPVPPDTLPDSPYVTYRVIPASNDRLWTLVTFPRALKQDGVELAHTQYTTPLTAPCPVITTVHDISFRLYPEWFPRKHRMLLNLTVPGSLRRAKRVLTDSHSSRRDILRVYRLPDEKVVTIPLAAGREYRPLDREDARSHVRHRLGIVDPYLLSVGVLQPRKNLPLLIEAFARARKKAAFPHKLVLTGKRGWGVESITRMIARLNMLNSITFTDYVEDADLPALYSAADAMAYPSLYEGFGLPPLEAMSCGTPTLVSDSPCMPEIAGNGAWVLPVIDAAPWGDAIARILTDPALQAEWSARGLERARDFDWARTGAATRLEYEKALDRRVGAQRDGN